MQVVASCLPFVTRLPASVAVTAAPLWCPLLSLHGVVFGADVCADLGAKVRDALTVARGAASIVM
jgi:hypothetical protein